MSTTNGSPSSRRTSLSSSLRKTVSKPGSRTSSPDKLASSSRRTSLTKKTPVKVPKGPVVRYPYLFDAEGQPFIIERPEKPAEASSWGEWVKDGPLGPRIAAIDLSCEEPIGSIAVAGVDEDGVPILAQSARTTVFIGDSGLANLVDHIKAAGCPNLRRLLLANNNITMQGVLRLATLIRSNGLAALEELDLSGNDIGPEGACELGSALRLCPSLKALLMGDNGIGVVGSRALAAGVLKRGGDNKSGADCDRLRCLNLHNNNMGDDGAAAIARALSGGGAAIQLEELSLKKNDIGPVGARAIASALAFTPGLKELHLNLNKLGDVGATAIGGSLLNCSQLRVLNLAGTDLSDAGLLAILPALTPQLTMLLLAVNRITDEGAKGVAALMAKGTLKNLLNLDLSSNAIGSSGVKALQDAKACCPGLTSFSLNNNKA